MFDSKQPSKLRAKKKTAAQPPPSLEPGPAQAGENLSFQLFTQPLSPDARQASGANGADHPAAGDLSSGAGAAEAGAPSASRSGTQPDGLTATAPFGVIIEDGSPIGAGQVYRTQFIAAISADIISLADQQLAAVGRTANDCPYLIHWLSFYRQRSASQIERAIQHYARPAQADLESLQEALLARVGSAVQAWINSGGREVQAPEGVAWLGADDRVSQPSSDGSKVQLQKGEGDLAPSDPAAVRAQLSNGRSLESSVRVRMERGFGQSLSDVRLHTDPVAARLNQSFSARAFTIGHDIAFGSGQYHPHTIAGDALLAHELAHVVQQGGGLRSKTGAVQTGAAESALEREAESAAERVVRRLWHTPVIEDDSSLTQTSAPAGLRLQRCSSDSPKPAPAPPSPDDQMREVLKQVLQDKTIVPAEWQRLNERSRALKVSEITLQDLAREPAVGGLDTHLSHTVAVLATRSGPALDNVRAAYTGSYAEGGDVLTPSPLPVLVREALADSSLDFAELDAIRTLALQDQLPDYGELRQALTAAQVDPAAIDGLVRLMDISGVAWKSLESDPVALPLQWKAHPQSGQLSSTSDLRVVLIRALTGDGEWSRIDFPIIRTMLTPVGRAEAKKLLVSAGFDGDTADRLAKQFTTSDFEYGQRMPQDIKFRRDGNKFALVTPLFPQGYVKPSGSTPALRVVGDAETITEYSFKSGVSAPADRQMVEVRGRQIPMIRPNREEDMMIRFSALLSANDGLAPVPPHHLALIKLIVLDPGARPDVAADAGYDGTVTLYWASAAGGKEAQRIMVHEVGHLVSFKAAATDTKFWPNWNEAAQKDDAAVSLYGTTNQLEDFAEAYLMFILNEAGTRKQFPHRAAIIAPLVNPPPPPSPTPAPKKP